MSKVSSRPAARAGFTMIEAIVIIVILGVIAAVIAPRILGRIGQSKQSVAATNAASLATAMRSYQADCGLPEPGTSLTVLWENPSDLPEGTWKGPYVENADALIDPWGNPYQLGIPAQKNVDFDIICYGKDGQPGGEDEDADVVKP